MTDPFDQHGHRVRLEWGGEGVSVLAGACAVLVVVDVLSFSTAVSVAVSRGATVLPLRWRDSRAAVAAESAGAVLAAPRSSSGWSLSPSSLLTCPPAPGSRCPPPTARRSRRWPLARAVRS